MSNRAKRRAIAAKHDFFRVVPMEVEDTIAGTNLQDVVSNVSYIDMPASECLVALVPPTLSYEMAREVEKRLTETLKRNVLVMSDNITLCRVEGPLDKKEVAAVFKGVENVDADKVAETLFNQAQKAQAEAGDDEGGEAEDPAEGG